VYHSGGCTIADGWKEKVLGRTVRFRCGCWKFISRRCDSVSHVNIGRVLGHLLD
jgi:hypothetical protein